MLFVVNRKIMCICVNNLLLVGISLKTSSQGAKLCVCVCVCLCDGVWVCVWGGGGKGLSNCLPAKGQMAYGTRAWCGRACGATFDP